jgi:transcriptional regulator with XRE-family HTH domain
VATLPSQTSRLGGSAHDRITHRKILVLDVIIGGEIREQRCLMGLSLQQLATKIGVTYQQAYKYERGINCITTGELHAVARALDVDTVSFFPETSAGTVEPMSGSRLSLELSRAVMAIRGGRCSWRSARWSGCRPKCPSSAV